MYIRLYLGNLHMTKQELIQWVKDEITASGALPLDQINDKEIERIIDNEKEYVHREWRTAVEPRMAVIPLSSFRTHDFKQSRTIQLPDCVYGIDDFREIKDGSRLFGISDPDLRLERVMGSDLWLSPFSSNVITSRTISYSWFDLARSFTLIDMQFRFNINTHRIQVIGHDPVADVLCRAYIAIDDADLYEDPMFRKWISAKCKMQLHRILKTFEVNLIGGVSISTILYDEGKAEKDEVENWRNGQEVPDYFLMFS